MLSRFFPIVLACACGAPASPHAPLPSPIAPVVAPEPATSAPKADETPSPPEPCDDTLGGALARVSCDGSRFLVAQPIELHPDRPAPAEPTASVLRAVSDVLHERKDILLVRIEVHVGKDVGSDPEKRRVALFEAQKRADALLQYLWRKRGVSAERLEAVAYERARGASGKGAWPVVLRIVQYGKH